jgi:DNA-binding FrmR family transcriptional regulator
MDAETKKAVRARLRRIAGQVRAVERMVDADRTGIDRMHQLAAVQAAIGKVA